jgi:hypothetical protein
LTTEHNQDGEAWIKMKVEELRASLNDICRVGTTKPIADITHDRNQRMFLDVEMMVRINAPLAQRTQI